MLLINLDIEKNDTCKGCFFCKFNEDRDCYECIFFDSELWADTIDACVQEDRKPMFCPVEDGGRRKPWKPSKM